LVTFLAITFLSSFQSGAKQGRTFLLMIPMCLTIYFTETRSIWLGFAGILAVLTFFSSNMRKPVIGMAVVVLILFLSGVASKFSPFENTLFSRRSETVDYRYVNMSTALNMF